MEHAFVEAVEVLQREVHGAIVLLAAALEVILERAGVRCQAPNLVIEQRAAVVEPVFDFLEESVERGLENHLKGGEVGVVEVLANRLEPREILAHTLALFDARLQLHLDFLELLFVRLDIAHVALNAVEQCVHLKRIALLLLFGERQAVFVILNRRAERLVVELESDKRLLEDVLDVEILVFDHRFIRVFEPRENGEKLREFVALNGFVGKKQGFEGFVDESLELDIVDDNHVVVMREVVNRRDRRALGEEIAFDSVRNGHERDNLLNRVVVRFFINAFDIFKFLGFLERLELLIAFGVPKVVFAHDGAFIEDLEF